MSDEFKPVDANTVALMAAIIQIAGGFSQSSAIEMAWDIASDVDELFIDMHKRENS